MCFVDIENSKDIKCVAKVEISWNGCIILEDQEEVHAIDYRINMDCHKKILGKPSLILFAKIFITLKPIICFDSTDQQ